MIEASQAPAAAKPSDCWGTPPPLARWCAGRYGLPLPPEIRAEDRERLLVQGGAVVDGNEVRGFDLDLFASPSNAKGLSFYTEEQDAFRQSFVARAAWENPPYSRGLLGPAVALGRAAVDRRDLERLVLVVPYTPGVGWWREQVLRPTARHLSQKASQIDVRADAEQRQATQDRYLDGAHLIEVTHSFGRVPFVRPPGLKVADEKKKAGGGRAEIAVVAFLPAEAIVESSRSITPGEARHHRESLGYTQPRLAAALGVAQSRIAQWEAGKRPTPRGQLLERLLALEPLPYAQRGRGPYRPRRRRGGLS